MLAERGLDPHIGSLHAIGDGHPALVSDLIEEFRALTVDAVVLRLLTQGDVEPGDFSYDDDGACRLGRPLRKTYLAALEAKLQSPVEHRLAGGGDYRRAMRAQVAHWIQVLEGSAPLYRPFMPR